MSPVLLDDRGREVEQRAVPPRRVRLPRAGLDRLARLAAVESPVTRIVDASGLPTGRDARLGEPAAAAHEQPVPDGDLDDALAAAGLLHAGTPTAEGSAVLAVWRAPALAVELEMLVVLRRGTVRVRSWHRNLDDWVVCLSTADGTSFELAWLSADDWWLELGRAAHVDTRTLRPAADAEAFPDVVETPWELLLATGEAVRRRRHDLLEQLVADHSGLTRAGATPDTLDAVDDSDVRHWHAQLEQSSSGRLHATVVGRSERGRPGAGIVEWVLLPGGWRSLTPFRRDGWTMVRIERVSAVDLPRALAVLAAEVTS